MVLEAAMELQKDPCYLHCLQQNGGVDLEYFSKDLVQLDQLSRAMLLEPVNPEKQDRTDAVQVAEMTAKVEVLEVCHQAREEQNRDFD